MPETHTAINELADRKRLLILEADLHRSLIGVEVARTRARFERGAQWSDRLAGHPWLLGGAATLVGVVGVRHWRSALKWVPAGLAAWRWWDKLRPR